MFFLKVVRTGAINTLSIKTSKYGGNFNYAYLFNFSLSYYSSGRFLRRLVYKLKDRKNPDVSFKKVFYKQHCWCGK